jgi:hypothetical protein
MFLRLRQSCPELLLITNIIHVSQVETELFPDMAESKLYLRSVDVDEILVQEYMEQAVEIVKLNSTGPQK